MKPSAQHGGLSAQQLCFSTVLLTFAYVALSTPAAYTSSSHTLAAIIWPAPAFAVALLWTLPYRQWFLPLLAVFMAMLIVGASDELPSSADAAFAALNVFEVGLFGYLGRRFVDHDGVLDTMQKLARFMVLLPLGATCLVATLGATIGMVTKQTSWLTEWRVMVVGNGLAILVLLPGLLEWFPHSNLQRPKSAPRQNQTAFVTGLMSVSLIVAAAKFDSISAEVLRALLSMILVWAAIEGGMKAASLGVLLAAASGIVITLAGYGPYSAVSSQKGALELQLDLASLAMLSFFVATAVRERQSLSQRLEYSRRFETIGLLAGGIAHDFNNILGAVAGYSELATEREKAGLSVIGPLTQVNAAVGRGKDLTEQILLAGRRGPRACELVDVRAVIWEAIETVIPLLESNTELDINLPTATIPILAHRGQVMRCILNLLRNAAQSANGCVNVRVEVRKKSGAISASSMLVQRPADAVVGELLSDNCVWIDVMDNGAGINPTHLRQLFDPFFSARSTVNGKSQGTGLGLAIVAGVASDHAGGVAAWSGHDEQTIFRLMLPLATTQTNALIQTPDVTSSSDPSCRGNGEPVLILADNTALRELLENTSAELGFEPTSYALSDMNSETVKKLLMHSPLILLAREDLDVQALYDLNQVVRQKTRLNAIVLCMPNAQQTFISYAKEGVLLAGAVNSMALGQAVTMAMHFAFLPSEQTVV